MDAVHAGVSRGTAMASSGSVTHVVRWSARIWGTVIALFWSTFFVEHLAWFNPWFGLPPLRVWLLEGVLFLLIAALLTAWRYELAGGMVALFAAIVFCAAVAGSHFWPFFLMTAPPAVAFIYCSMRSTQGPSALRSTG